MIVQKEKYVTKITPSDYKANRFRSLLGYLTLSTGIFALISSLYSWGEGLIFTVETPMILIIAADLFITVPASLILSYGIFDRKPWVSGFRWFPIGMYLWGSAMVYIIELSGGAPYNIIFLLIPLSGISLAIFLILWKNN
jgi:hypothetical protein